MAHRSITASELKCCALDRDWLRRWRAGENPSTFTFAPPGTPNAMSREFHREARRLEDWLVSPEAAPDAARIVSPDVLLDRLWTTSLQAFTDELFAQNRGEEALLFTARMQTFCTRLIALRERTKNFRSWQDVFIGAEEALGRIVVPVEGETVEVRARVDAIRFHPVHHLEVVDYKLSQGNQQKADLVQLAIYAHLLALWRPGAPFCGTLEYYLPEFHEVHVSPADLADIFSGLVAPVLREIAQEAKPDAKPVSKTGPRTRSGRGADEPAGAPVSESMGEPAAAPEAAAETDALGARVVAAYAEFKLGVDVADVIRGPQLVRIKLTPQPGVKVVSLANRADDLQVKLVLGEPPLIKAGKGFVMVDLPRAEPEACLLEPALAGPLGTALASPVAFPVGIGVEGDPVVADLASPSTCHVLVAGQTGSGKSEWLKALVATLALRASPDAVRIALVDPKMLTFTGIERSRLLWRPLATTLGDAMAILREAVAEMERRYETLSREGFVNLGDRRAAGKTELPFLVLIFDEFADLILAGREERKEFEGLVARIAGKGRAAGVHLVLATQRPDRSIVTGLIKANLPLKVCLQVANGTNAQIVLDEPGAESLFGRGDLLCDFGKGLLRAQGLFIPQTDFLRAVGRD
ncbi:Cell division protein FtsK [Rhodovulum sp. PH10]|uniref:DNA translocase FtsK n=1 Tax=Rhodovulum sp. PH10 TaxID=1187851 RepID=UPI00027C2C54|nr:DNA translocase FtsK [Rhodovulum sp. PH10]EJW11113.1 Cell division protein FtsK [Rhodovulum sp. PH10]